MKKEQRYGLKNWCSWAGAGVIAVSASGVVALLGRASHVALTPPVVQVRGLPSSLLGEIRVLQRRARAIGEGGVDTIERVVVEQQPTDVGLEPRIERIEAAMAGVLTSMDVRNGVGMVMWTMDWWTSLVRDSSLPVTVRSQLYGRISAVADGVPFITTQLADAWLRDAHLLSGHAGLGRHLVAARHLAPVDAMVQKYLISTLLLETDEELRAMAMVSLGHCVWSSEVHEAMRVVASGAGSASLRKAAASWLEKSAVKEVGR